MTPEEMKAAEESRAKADAEAGEKLDKLLSGIDSVSKRLDSIEAKADAAHSRMDAMEEEETEEKKAADKAKRDAEEEAEKKAAAEKAEADKKADSVNIEERVRAELDKRLPARLSDEDHRKLADAQAKADSVFQAFGDAAPRPLDGESLLAYRRRVATTLKSHSPAWKPVDLAAIADSVAFEVAEGQIYKDAREAARNPVDLGDNELREIVRVDSATGTRKIDFVGKHSFVRGFKAPTTARVTKFLTSGRERS
jgi:chromosome segregation ATPase